MTEEEPRQEMKFNAAHSMKTKESVDCFQYFVTFLYGFCMPGQCEFLKDRDHTAPCLKNTLSECLFKRHENMHLVFSEHPLWTELVYLPWSLPSGSVPSKELIGYCVWGLTTNIEDRNFGWKKDLNHMFLNQR